MGNIRYVARNFLYTPVAGVDAMVQAVLAGRYFSPWYAVGNLAQFDDRRKEVHFSKVGLSVKEDAYIIAYRDLAGCDLLENGKMVERGSLVGAVTGEALFDGLEGALLGSMACAYDEAYCTSKTLSKLWIKSTRLFGRNSMNNRLWAFSCLSPLAGVVFVALLLHPALQFRASFEFVWSYGIRALGAHIIFC